MLQRHRSAWRRGDGATSRRDDVETGRHRDAPTGRQGESASELYSVAPSPRRPVVPSPYRFIFLSLCICVVVANSVTFAQKRPVEPGKIVQVEVVREVAVPPKEGYLTIFTTARARVALTPSRQNSGGRPARKEADEKGIVVFDKLSPGGYELEITREDYKSLASTIAIERGRPTAVVGLLIPIYGAIVLAMGNQAAADVVVTLNDVRLEPTRLKLEEGRLYVRGVPVGVHKIDVSKPGYSGWSQERVIQPGDCENLITVTLEREAVALTVRSAPNAAVFIDNAMKGRITANGTLRIADLDPGLRKLRVSLEGYEDAERPLKLSMEKREHIEEVALNPLADETEFRETFNPKIANWHPGPPPGWRFGAAGASGLAIVGDTLALANNTNRPTRAFNIYGDFTLIINVRFTNGRGASWVARARDVGNYYLFELNRQERTLNFYVCRDGACSHKRQDIVLADLSEEGAFFRIRLDAKGNNLTHKIYTRSGVESLGGVIVDDAFRYGGVGLRAINGLEMFVNEFFVAPLRDAEKR